MSKVVAYSTGTPPSNGKYAVRVVSLNTTSGWDDMFLMFVDGVWGYPSSDQNYRGEVKYWIGPLQRRMKHAS